MTKFSLRYVRKGSTFSKNPWRRAFGLTYISWRGNIRSSWIKWGMEHITRVIILWRIQIKRMNIWRRNQRGFDIIVFSLRKRRRVWFKRSKGSLWIISSIITFSKALDGTQSSFNSPFQRGLNHITKYSYE